MSVCLIPVTPMQHVTTVLVASPVLVTMAIQEMDFNVMVSMHIMIYYTFFVYPKSLMPKTLAV